MENSEDIDAQIREDIANVIAHQRHAHGVCPLMGIDCVGPQNCAPARFHAQYLQACASQGADVEDAAQPHAICPIVRLVDSVSVTAHALLPLVLGAPDDEDDEPKETLPPVNETSEQRIIRERNAHKLQILAGVKVDQQ